MPCISYIAHLSYLPAGLDMVEEPDGGLLELLEEPPARDAIRYIKATTARQRIMVASCQLSATSDSTGGGGRGAVSSDGLTRGAESLTIESWRWRVWWRWYPRRSRLANLDLEPPSGLRFRFRSPLSNPPPPLPPRITISSSIVTHGLILAVYL